MISASLRRLRRTRSASRSSRADRRGSFPPPAFNASRLSSRGSPCFRRRSSLSCDLRHIGFRGDHGLRPAFGHLGQRLNQRSFGEVPPVFLRHLRLHGLRLQPRRIEDAGVVAAPDVFDSVLGRRFAFRHAVGERQFAVMPVDTALGRQDRPVHVAEAIDEERGGELDDMMLGLEPGDEARLAAR